MISDAWFKRAACADVDTRLFFPDHGRISSERPEMYSDVKPVCEACPVRAECLSYALRHNEEGMWGGTTEKERRRLKRMRKRAS